MEIGNLQFFKNKDFDISKINDSEYIVNLDDKKYLLELYEGKLDSFVDKNNENSDYLNEINNKFTKIESTGFEDGYTFVIKKHIEDDKLNLSDVEQIQIGNELGKVIRKLHEDSKIDDDSTWAKVYNYKINNIIYNYSMTNYRGKKDYIIFDYIDKNRYLIDSRGLSNVILLDDFRNLLLNRDEYEIIRSNISYLADPYFEFKKINEIDPNNRILYYSMLKSYFNGKIPRLFYRILAIYTIVDILESKLNGDNDVDLTEEFDEILEIYNDFDCIVPVWIQETQERVRELLDESEL